MELGHLACQRGEYHKSLDFYRKALMKKESKSDPNPDSIALIYYSIATVTLELKDPEEALNHYNRAQVIYQNIYGDECMAVPICLHNIAMVFIRQEQLGKALEYLRKALKIMETLLPAAYYMKQDYKQALVHSEKALEIYKKTLPPMHENIHEVSANIAATRSRM